MSEEMPDRRFVLRLMDGDTALYMTEGPKWRAGLGLAERLTREEAEREAYGAPDIAIVELSVDQV